MFVLKAYQTLFFFLVVIVMLGATVDAAPATTTKGMFAIYRCSYTKLKNFLFHVCALFVCSVVKGRVVKPSQTKKNFAQLTAFFFLFLHG